MLLALRIFLSFFLFTLSWVSFSQPTGYGYGKQITIDATEVAGGSALTNFPVMIRFMGAGADLDLRSVANGGHVENSTGYDIIFTSDHAGTVTLDHQIEFYDAATGEYVAWVRIPSLSNSTDTQFFMYYGNCSVSANPSTTAVWNSDFDAVYPLHNDVNDATINGRTGTNTGSTDLSPALIADGQTFGANNYIQIPSSSISPGQGTVSAWVNATSFSGNHQYIFGHTTTPVFGNRIQLYTNDATGLLDLGLGNNHNLNTNFYNLNTSEWYFVVLTWNGTNYAVYVNGASQASGTYAGLGTLETYLDVGNNGSSATRNEAWIGGIDHVRLSNEVFNANWIQTEYNNQRDGSVFYTTGAEFSASSTFYSLTSGAWETNTTWSFTPDGSSGAVSPGIFPRRSDNVVIQNGHTITINNINDNGGCPLSPDGLGLTNVGPFVSSNIDMFYHAGDITIEGTLNVTGIEMMVSGYTHILPAGTFSLASYLVNVGFLEADATSTLSTLDDFVITGNSTTIINTNSTSADDIIIDHTDATLCGTGTATLQNGGGSTITYANSATVSQVCTSFTINCTGVGCSGFPVVGTSTVILGNIGPGGIGNQNNNQLWLKADDLNLVNGAAVTSWADASGNGLTAISSGIANEEPTFNTNAVNTTLPSISFDGGDFLNIGTPASLNLIPGTDSWSFFIVYNVAGATPQGTFFSKATATGGTRQYQYTIDDNAGTSRFSSSIGGTLTVGSVVATNAWFVSAHTNNTTQKNSWTNEGSDFVGAAIGAGQVQTAEVLIGARRDTGPTTGTGFHLTGDIAEIAMYDLETNAAQRIIIDNYLAAKYDITIANDVYTMDNGGNGNYDFEVAGIGQATDGSYHKDARGSGIVRMLNPSGLDDNEFLLWGHDNGALMGTVAGVDGIVIEERLVRIWRLSESGGNVGNVSVSFDFNGIGTPLGSNLRLLIDRDGDGFADNDVTPVAGSVSNGIAVFSNVNFQDGDRFTLGNTDASIPLPIELIDFQVSAESGKVLIQWSTASELNNDFFTVEKTRSPTDEWMEVLTVKGAGNSTDLLTYHAVDYEPLPERSYYRLKQTDFDGTVSYSPTLTIVLDEPDQQHVYPNPSTGIFQLQSSFTFSPENIRLFNTLGKSVPYSMSTDGANATFDIHTLSPGVYILQVSNGVKKKSYRIVKQ